MNVLFTFVTNASGPSTWVGRLPRHILLSVGHMRIHIVFFLLHCFVFVVVSYHKLGWSDFDMFRCQAESSCMIVLCHMYIMKWIGCHHDYPSLHPFILELQVHHSQRRNLFTTHIFTTFLVLTPLIEFDRSFGHYEHALDGPEWLQQQHASAQRRLCVLVRARRMEENTPTPQVCWSLNGVQWPV